MQDIELLKNDEGIYDMSITNGDFTGIDGLDTAILMSFLIDKRAESSEVGEPSARRGWIGNEQNEDTEYEVGSKLWLLEQARVTQSTVNKSIDFSDDCVSWFIEDQLLKAIQVTGNVVGQQNITDNVTFVRFDNSSFSKQFDLWENTNLV